MAKATRKKYELVEASKTMKAKLYEIKQARERQRLVMEKEIDINKELQERKKLMSPKKNIFSEPPKQSDKMMEQIEKIDEENQLFLSKNKKIFIENKALKEEITYWEVTLTNPFSSCLPFIGRDEVGRQSQGTRTVIYLLRVLEKEAT